jgi:hypothetical protein
VTIFKWIGVNTMPLLRGLAVPWPFFAIFVSPPVFLILKRWNIDVLIATMMIAAGYFGSSVAILAVAFLMSARANLYGVNACGVQGFKWACGRKVLPNVIE